MPLSDGGKALSMRGEQCLVGRDDGFAGSKRGLDRDLCRTRGTADHLDQDIDSWIARQRRRIGNPAKFSRIKTALLVTRSRADGDHLDRPAATGDELVAAVLEQANDGTADGAEAGKTDFQRLRHDASPGLGWKGRS
jgi:hypothetical protein